MTFVFLNRDFLPLILLLAFSLVLSSCSAKIQGRSEESYRSSDFSIHTLDEGGLALLPVMVLARPAKPEKEAIENGYPNAPFSTTETQQTKDSRNSIVTGEAYRIAISDILLSNIRHGDHNIRVLSPGECLKYINDAGLTYSYLKFDRDFTKTGIDETILSNFARVLKCRYLFISQAVIYEYTSDSSVTMIWTFGKKSTLRSVNVTGQIWDSVMGRRIWVGRGVGYNEMSAYEKTPLTEDMIDKAIERLINTMMRTPGGL